MRPGEGARRRPLISADSDVLMDYLLVTLTAAGFPLCAPACRVWVCVRAISNIQRGATIDLRQQCDGECTVHLNLAASAETEASQRFKCGICALSRCQDPF